MAPAAGRSSRPDHTRHDAHRVGNAAKPDQHGGGACSADATFLGFSDALGKTRFDGQPVAGLSALNVTGPHSAVALVDNVGTTPARVFDLRVNSRPTSVRVIWYFGLPGREYRPIAQYAYEPDPGLALVELAWVSPTKLVSMERTYTPGAGNTIRVFTVSLRGAVDVTAQESLAGAPSSVFLRKKLLFDLVDCPPSGAVAKQPQPNPLLDNVEALALGGYLPGGRQLYLMSDDNNGATQITRLYSLAVDLA